MFDSVNRREFLEQTAAAAVALQLAGSIAFSAEPAADKLPGAQTAPAGATVPAGQTPSADLMSYVDPILRPTGTILPEAENALPLLMQAANALTEMPDGDFEIEDCFSSAKPDAERDRRIAAWLDQYRLTLPMVEQAVARGKVEFPTTPWTSDRFDDMHPLRNLARFMQMHARRLMFQGKLAEAAQVTRTVRQAFRLMEAGGGVNVEYLVVVACHGSSWWITTRIAAHPKADAKLVRGMLADIPAHQDPLGGLRRSIQAEFCYYVSPDRSKNRRRRRRQIG